MFPTKKKVHSLRFIFLPKNHIVWQKGRLLSANQLWTNLSPLPFEVKQETSVSETLVQFVSTHS